MDPFGVLERSTQSLPSTTSTTLEMTVVPEGERRADKKLKPQQERVMDAYPPPPAPSQVDVGERRATQQSQQQARVVGAFPPPPALSQVVVFSPPPPDSTRPTTQPQSQARLIGASSLPSAPGQVDAFSPPPPDPNRSTTRRRLAP